MQIVLCIWNKSEADYKNIKRARQIGGERPGFTSEWCAPAACGSLGRSRRLWLWRTAARWSGTSTSAAWLWNRAAPPTSGRGSPAGTGAQRKPWVWGVHGAHHTLVHPYSGNLNLLDCYQYVQLQISLQCPEALKLSGCNNCTLFKSISYSMLTTWIQNIGYCAYWWKPLKFNKPLQKSSPIIVAGHPISCCFSILINL